MFTDKRLVEIAGGLLILGGLLLILSLASFHPGDEEMLLDPGRVMNFIGPLGAAMAYGLRLSLGHGSWVVAAAVLWAGLAVVRGTARASISERLLAVLFFSIVFSALIVVFSQGDPLHTGGAVGIFLHGTFVMFAGKLGACLLILAMNISALILLGVLSLSDILNGTGRFKMAIGDNLQRIVKRDRKALPLIDVGPVTHQGRLPWIVKKKIPLYDPDRVRDCRDAIEGGDLYSPETGTYVEEIIEPDKFHDEQEYMPVTISKPVTVFDNREILEAEFRTNNSLYPEKEKQRACGSVTGLPPENLVVLEEDILPSEDTCPDYDDSCDVVFTDSPPVEIESGDCEPAGYLPCEEPDDEPQTVSRPACSMDAGGTGRAIVLEGGEYAIPVDYLRFSAPRDNDSYEQEIKRNSVLLVNTLQEFGIESRVVNVNRGPVITLYEMQIAPGIKVNKIVGLSDDIAMALAASRVRIVAPIPGKSAIGVEVPNREREMVTLGDIISTDRYQSQTGALKVALGKDILGKPVTLDLKKLPHLLIAGATGSGKSVCVNGIITSIVYNYDPSYVRFILVDPKMVELQVYNGLPHLLTPVITEPHVAPLALKWAIYEMDRRYRLLSEISCRDIERYNEKIRETGEAREPLPYIVTIIDELADLMMVASKEIEGYITRIAQKARAVGIHLVLATQRPSVDIITGIIKANFPARIAFQVAQKTDSRTIIDQNGAEKLLGRGDMLYQSPMSSFPIRIQGAFIGEEEIGSIVDHLSGRYDVHYIDLEECLVFTDEDKPGEEAEDELFVDALKIVEETRKASASYLQRRLQIGYNRAARLVEQMEELGYVGPQQGSKPREVYI